MANLKGSTNVAYVYKLLVCDSSKMFHLAAAQIEKNVYIPHCQSFRVQLRSLRCLLNLMISCAQAHLTAASCLPLDGRFGGSPQRDAQEARMHDSSSAARSCSPSPRGGFSSAVEGEEAPLHTQHTAQHFGQPANRMPTKATLSLCLLRFPFLSFPAASYSPINRSMSL